MRGTNRTVMLLAQGILASAVAYFVWRALRAGWSEFHSLPLRLTFRPGPVVAAAGIVLATYAVLIESWRRVLGAWGHHIAWRPAARVWTLSNLGRYVPGKVWAVAGLAYLGERAGVSGWAAIAAAVVLQVMSLGTGAAVVAIAVPGAITPWTAAAAGALATGTVIAAAWPRVTRSLSRWVPRLNIPGEGSPKPAPLFAAVAATTVAWLTYGLALWSLAWGIIPESSLSVRLAAGAFAAGYLGGLLALFAPGGIGVREGLLYGLLQPSIGAPAALSLALASRLLLTVAELLAALAAWAIATPHEEPRL